MDIKEIQKLTDEARANNVPFTNQIAVINSQIELAAKKGAGYVYFSFRGNDMGVPTGSGWEKSSNYKLAQHFESLGFKVSTDRRGYDCDVAVASGFVIGLYINW